MMNLFHHVLRPSWRSIYQTRATYSATFRSLHDFNAGCDANLYEVLGVSPTCSETSIRDAFRKLAKATHPDMLANGNNNPDAARFIVILSAYQILSNPTTREQYDTYLRDSLKMHCPFASNTTHSCDQSHETEDANVVHWLKWYRGAITTIINQHKIGSGHGSQEKLKGDFHEALRRAYFGPCLNDIHILPDCFEAEERAVLTESEVLHLVSGHTVIGVVRQVGSHELLKEGTPKLAPNSTQLRWHHTNSQDGFEGFKCSNIKDMDINKVDRKAYVGLELYLFGNLIAKANRTRFTSNDGSFYGGEQIDKISIYWHDDVHANQDALLGTIIGLSMTEFGGRSKVYSPNGDHTHEILHFSTPWVKHMHWFKVNDRRMRCECRSTRARLPPSRFWLFRPRCDTHDIGGWYIETRWRRSLLNSGDLSAWAGKHLGFLHPAMYIIGAAYKTLDTEAIQKQKGSWWSMMVSRAFKWCQNKFPS